MLHAAPVETVAFCRRCSTDTTASEGMSCMTAAVRSEASVES